jgi:precorrin-2 dehydrogenase/sirohydrochlorin ferrochelatase
VTQSLNPYFQVGLNVLDKTCLIVGGGREAAEKSSRLLRAGARVRLVSPSLAPQLEQLGAEQRFEYLPRRFDVGDLGNVFLVLNTVGTDQTLAEEIFALTRERRILLNTYDQPGLSDIGMAALVAPGHLRLSISTSNASPGLARRLREDLENLFDGEFVQYLERLAEVRQHLKTSEGDGQKRLEKLRSTVRDFRLGGHLQYPQDWRRRLDELVNGDSNRE